MISTEEFMVSGSPAVHSTQRCTAGAIASPVNQSPPPTTDVRGNASVTSAVTTPKLPRQPSSAQNRSGSVSGVTVRGVPSAVTTSSARTRSAA
jgi:hypothetical protein